MAMPGMKRFVTYIYSYENKVKGSNTGFARLEVRGANGRIEIHLRGVLGRTACKVYLFRLDGRKMEGFYIGEFRIMNGAGDFTAVFQAEQIAASPFGFADLDGVVIFGEDRRMFLSRWTEGEEFAAQGEYFYEWKQNGDDTADQDKSAQEPTQISDAEPEYHRARPADHADEEAIRLPEREHDHQITQQANAISDERERSGQRMETEETKNNTKQEDVAATEIPMQNIFPLYTWQEIWETMGDEHQIYTPFEENEIQCMRIELKNLRQLPRQHWYLGNNSFLLHGFFNYHYLILGRERERFFLGVPGIFQRQEHVMAIIFGFPEFLPSALEMGDKTENGRETAEPLNRFGFWIHWID